ncbi:hypothetical protein [Helicobacter sp. T3_23-1059]
MDFKNATIFTQNLNSSICGIALCNRFAQRMRRIRHTPLDEAGDRDYTN